MGSTIDIGIDLGTTNSAIAVQEGRTAVLLKNASGDALLPSAVHVAPAGTLTVGAGALRHRGTDHANTAVEFKRLMGTEETLEFPASGKTMTPPELSAAVLRQLAARASTRLRAQVRAAAITVPAMFQLPQCEATRRAAELAGIQHAPLLQEPIAAAFAHAGAGGVRDGHWLVYDLGGGTFDVSLVRAQKGRLRIVDHDGDNRLGGKDLDRKLARRATEEIRNGGQLGEFRRTDPNWSSAFAKLKLEAERVRIALSECDLETFHVGDLAQREGGELVGVEFSVDRGEMEAMVTPVLRRTTSLCRRLLSRNRIEAHELHGLVLVGGPTRTPCIIPLIREELGLEPRHVMDPTVVVAMGAAMFASTEKLPRALRARRPGGDDGTVELDLETDTMTTNPAPLLVGRVDGDSTDLTVAIARDDGGFESEPAAAGSAGAFAIQLQLLTDQLNLFHVRAFRGGQSVDCAPATFTVIHGVSIGKPPLSRSVGVMLADNTVRWYLRKGRVLPARAKVTHATTAALRKGQSADAINVPLIQGEAERADRNKVIGILRIHAEKIDRDLPAGTEVEVSLSVDEFSHTHARAYVPMLHQWFDDVAMIALETKPLGEVERSLEDQKSRLAELARQAEGLDDVDADDLDERVQDIEELLEEGDRDAVDGADQMVRYMTSQLDRVDVHSRASRIDEVYRSRIQQGRDVMQKYGTAQQQADIEALDREYQQAWDAGDLDLAETRSAAIYSANFQVLKTLPFFWEGLFENLVKSVEALGLSQSAGSVISRGRNAIQLTRYDDLVKVCDELMALLPEQGQGAAGLLDSQIVSDIT